VSETALSDFPLKRERKGLYTFYKREEETIKEIISEAGALNPLPEQTNKVSSRDTDSELGVDLKEVALAGQSQFTQGVDEQSTENSTAGDDGCRSLVTTAEHLSYA